MVGNLEPDLLEALLETLPVEFSVVGADDRVVAWNRHGTRIFKRPEAALGRNVRDCHPRKSLGAVERIIGEMREGKRETARFWIDLPIGPGGSRRKVLIEYFALRGTDGGYLGCLEASREVSDIQALTGERRLLD